MLLALLVVKEVEASCSANYEDYEFRHYQFGESNLLSYGSHLISNKLGTEILSATSNNIALIKF